MRHEERRLHDYLADIIEAQVRIAGYVDGKDFDSFLMNRMMQDAVIRNFEVIGEASKHIRQRFAEFVASHPEIPLSDAYKLRNVVAHGYHDVDYEIIWKTIHQKLPDLAQQAKTALQSLLDHPSET